MRNKKLISMFLLPAILVACNNDEFISDFNDNGAKEVVEGLALNVSLDATSTRGAYAGASNGVFQNFYFEPEYLTGADDGKLNLSDNTALRGDMLGLCLTSGSSAITNLPFYIAGYGSKKGDGAGAKTKIFTFDAQSSDASLYYLGLDDTQELDGALYTGGSTAKALIDASAAAIKAKEANADLAADEMDVRKAILRSNAGVMTGKYVAYYPYNKGFVEAGGIPVPEIGAITATSAALSDNAAAAITASDFYNKMFACSSNTVDVQGGTKTADLSMNPVTGAIVFKIFNTSNANSPEIKLITVKATENAATTDFALNGKMSLGATNSFVAGDKTTEMVGVSFTAAAINANTAENAAKYAMLPCYTASTKPVTVYVYTTDGKVAEFPKANVQPGNAKAVTYNIDLKDATFKPAARYVYDAASFLAEAATEGELILLDDITITSGSDVDLTKELTIKGNHTLTFTKGANNFKVSAALTFTEGAKLELDGIVAVAEALNCVDLTVKGVPTFAKAVTADNMTISASAKASLAEATIGTLTNKGTFETAATGTVKKVTVTTFNNEMTATVAADTELAAETLNAAAGSTLTVNGKLTSTSITTAATEPEANNAATVTIADGAETSAATVVNNGTLTWSTVKDMNLKITNNGEFTIDANCNFTGSLDNTGVTSIAEDKTVTGSDGTITNNGGDITVAGILTLSTTKLNVVSGRLISKGTVNGNTNITIAEGAEFIKTVGTKNELEAALNNVSIAGKYTGVEISTEISDAAAIDTNKKLYLAASLTLAKASKLNGGVVVTADATLTSTESTEISEITIETGATLTIGENSNLNVLGVITNNGTYKSEDGAVVYCTGIAGNGTWTNYPIF